MDGLRALVVALLLCVALIGGVVVAEPTEVTPEVSQHSGEGINGSMIVFSAENSSEYLAPPHDRIDRTDGQTSGLDVAAAVELDVSELESAYIGETLERRYGDAETDAEREAAVEGGIERLTIHVDGLIEAERTAIRRYNEGTIGPGELLRTLAAVSRSVDATVDSLEWAEIAADDLGMDAQAERAATERIRLVSMEGPLRAELADALAGDGTLRVYVETADEGIVLAAMDRRDDTYLREAHDPSAKTEGVSDQYEGNPSPALDRFSELYPWAINSFDGIDAIGPEQTRLYRFSATHSHGELETYLDSGSTDILHERQRIHARSAPSTTAERTDGDLRIVLNHTRAGGPLGVSVVDATTGGSLDGDVEIAGEPIGSTRGHRLWTVAPRGSVTINATHDGSAVSISRTFN